MNKLHRQNNHVPYRKQVNASINVIKISHRTYVLEFPSQKELCLSMFRLSEFSEGVEGIRGQKFTADEFIDKYSNEKGVINYFNYFDGFNIPMLDITRFVNIFKKELSNREIEVIQSLKGIYEDGYVIGIIKGDDRALKHEIAHNMYYENAEYKYKVLKIINSIPKELYNRLEEGLIKSEYAQDRVKDEINAYIIAYERKEFNEIFDVRINELTYYKRLLTLLFKEYDKV
jgi:hypothetical protein